MQKPGGAFRIPPGLVVYEEVGRVVIWRIETGWLHIYLILPSI